MQFLVPYVNNLRFETLTVLQFTHSSDGALTCCRSEGHCRRCHESRASRHSYSRSGGKAAYDTDHCEWGVLATSFAGNICHQCTSPGFNAQWHFFNCKKIMGCMNMAKVLYILFCRC